MTSLAPLTSLFVSVDDSVIPIEECPGHKHEIVVPAEDVAAAHQLKGVVEEIVLQHRPSSVSLRP